MADLVPEHCDGCSGRGVVGNILDTRECDWCNGTGFADPAKASTLSPEDFGAIKYRQEIRRSAIHLSPDQLEELMTDTDTLLRLFDAANN